MTANIARPPTSDDVAAAAARLKGTPQQLAAQLQALLDDGAPKPPKSSTARLDLAVADHRAAVQRHEADVDALRHRLAVDFAAERGWCATTAPLATKELARRSAGGNWHRPPREWLEALANPTFYRDARRRAAAAVGHPSIEHIESGREQIEAWAAERDLSASFPDWPSWTYPGRTALVLFEPAEPAELAPAAEAPASVQPEPAPARWTDEVEQPAAPVEPKLDTPPAPAIAPDLATMRPIAPIELGDVAPADLTGEIGPDFDIVAPTELLIDESYQRGLSPKSIALIRRIVENWSWSRFKAPTCVKVDGRLHVVDGQHTCIAAASHGGIAAIPVLVVAVPEVADRAAAFVSHARNRLQATAVQIHRAALVAGDKEAVTVEGVCRGAGVELLPFPPSTSEYGPRQTVAVVGIRQLIARRGAERAREILEALARADLAPISGDHVRIGEALLCDPAYAYGLDPERLTAAMRGLTARVHAEAREIAIAKRISNWRALVAVLYRNSRRARPKGSEVAEAGPSRRRSA